jgi:pimeloyl-ACP methyl ester carboxylesterase
VRALSSPTGHNRLTSGTAAEPEPEEGESQLSAHTELTGGRLRSRDGTLLGYLCLGAGPTVVCLHGGFNTGLDWLPVARLLADRYRLVLVDRRGHGVSDSGMDGHTLDLEVEDLTAVLAETGPAHAVLAHSFGALVALHAATGPLADRIGALILYEPPMLLQAGEAGVFEMLDEHIAAGRYEAAMSGALTRVLDMSEQDLRQLRRSSTIWAGMVAAAPSVPAQTRIMAAAAATVDEVRDIDLPTLLLVGEYSDPGTFRSSVERLADRIPDAQVVTLAGQGHSAMSRGPEALAGEVEKFLIGR